MFFGLTIEKLILIGVIAAVLIGPERLPAAAESLRRAIVHVRGLARSAQERVREELGPEITDVDWQRLDPRRYDPRRIVREALLADPSPMGEPAPVAGPSPVVPPAPTEPVASAPAPVVPPAPTEPVASAPAPDASAPERVASTPARVASSPAPASPADQVEGAPESASDASREARPDTVRSADTTRRTAA
ncbi:twin-arginine translocase TatA/TatE family subunit [Microbacterium testaceum]|uniref:twin-arginine translocase TatA/TatE family subunit n=1 Tax=Microbacterium testaceum TaxID=2033 RepID=UPI001246DF82|nr:twin-arginine translocase TatA/TatE family subunit [Microbacterium testaceum]